MLWGCFGLLRFIYLNDTPTKKLPKILNLPSRILFGINQEKEAYINNALKIYSSKFFFIFGLAFIGYIALDVYYYASTLHDMTQQFDMEIVSYIFLSHLVKLLIISLIVLSSISFIEFIKIKIGKNS